MRGLYDVTKAPRCRLPLGGQGPLRAFIWASMLCSHEVLSVRRWQSRHAPRVLRRCRCCRMPPGRGINMRARARVARPLRNPLLAGLRLHQRPCVCIAIGCMSAAMLAQSLPAKTALLRQRRPHVRTAAALHVGPCRNMRCVACVCAILRLTSLSAWSRPPSAGRAGGRPVGAGRWCARARGTA
eukprot:364052-Chlamydomonas_euryale.AAC.3